MIPVLWRSPLGDDFLVAKNCSSWLRSLGLQPVPKAREHPSGHMFLRRLGTCCTGNGINTQVRLTFSVNC